MNFLRKFNIKSALSNIKPKYFKFTNYRFSNKSNDSPAYIKPKLDYDDLELILQSSASSSKIELSKKIIEKEKKNMIYFPVNCNIINLAKGLKKDVKTVKSDFKKIIGYEVSDELEYLPKDDIEMFLLEKRINFEFKEYDSEIKRRPIIVTIMGHVDHGKTTLLDTLRDSKIADKEFGKITQSIGAFTVKTKSGQDFTVIDTPGHEAFTKMRERGAKVTDCIILVVSCIEGAQKQTLEIIKLAENLKIPIIVALNKIDRIDDEQNSPVLHELFDNGLKLTKFGGNVPVCFISAKKKINIELLENEILKLSKKLDLKEEQNLPAQAFVIESKYINEIDKTNASVIIKKGKLKQGDNFICGNTYGKVKSMKNDIGEIVNEALPGYAIEINGFKESPQSGSLLIAVESQFEAERINQERLKVIEYEQNLSKRNVGLGIKLEIETNKERHLLMRKGDSELLEKKIQENKFKTELNQDELNQIYLRTKDIPKTIILRVDTEGVLETILDELNRIVGDDVVNKIMISKKIGIVTEDDFAFAKQANSTIFCFNIECTQEYEFLSNFNKIGLRFHKLIYEIVEELRVYLLEVALKVTKFDLKIIKGKAVIQEVFKLKINSIFTFTPLDKHSLVGGFKVEKGELYSAMKYRLIRNGEVERTELVATSFKKDKVQQTSMTEGEEGGIIFEDYEAYRKGDIIECYDMVAGEKSGISGSLKCCTLY